MCKPYLVTIKDIYHQHYGKDDDIIFRLATDEMGNVIKEPWSPHGSNSDDRLDSLVYGYALHHITDTIRGKWVFAEDALELCGSDEDELQNFEIIYPVGPNFMTKTVEIDWKAMVATVREMERNILLTRKKWIMAVYEIKERNTLNDTEYLIGLPPCDLPEWWKNLRQELS